MSAREPKPTRPGEWFPADVYITDTKTGEPRVYRTWETRPDAEGLGGVEFSWSEHNNACDCNRALFFARAADEDEAEVEVEVKCGDGRYRVDRIVDVERNEIVYTEEPAEA